MLQSIKEHLLKIIGDIDAGNSNLEEADAVQLMHVLKEYTNENKTYNRTKAANYLHCSVQTFDLYRKRGFLPKGHKEVGGVMQWTKKQLDDFIKKYKQ